MKAFDLDAAIGGAKIVTREGKAVHLLTRKRKSDTHPLVGLVTRGDDEGVETFTLDGRYYTSDNTSRHDLFMETVIQTRWINVYSPTAGRDCHHYATEALADIGAGSDRTACIKIEWEL